MPQPLRSVLAVIAGFLSMAVIVFVCTLLCVKLLNLQYRHSPALYPSVNGVYSLAAAMIGGFVTAKIARRAPLMHGVALGLVMVALNAVPYRHYSGSHHFAYHVFLLFVPPLAAIAGAALDKGRW